jgi:hypothetical protein
VYKRQRGLGDVYKRQVPFTVRGNLSNTKVNTNRAVDGAERRVFNVANRHEVELAIHQNKLGLSSLSLKKLGLVLTADKRYVLSTCHSPDAYLLLVKNVAQYSGIVRDSSVGAKGALCEPVRFVGIGNLGKEQCNYLGSKSGVCANGFVPLTMQVKTLESLRGERASRDPVSDLVGGFQCLLEGFALLLRGQELDLCYEFHRQHSIINMTNNQERTGVPRSLRQTGVTLLPCLKASKGFPRYLLV